MPPLSVDSTGILNQPLRRHGAARRVPLPLAALFLRGTTSTLAVARRDRSCQANVEASAVFERAASSTSVRRTVERGPCRVGVDREVRAEGRYAGEAVLTACKLPVG